MWNGTVISSMSVIARLKENKKGWWERSLGVPQAVSL